MHDYRRYNVQRSGKEPLLAFVLNALEKNGCRILQSSEANEAPFRITFETNDGERLGIVVYAFFANSRLTKNRPEDEHRFQVKYGPDDKRQHPLWQDPYLLYTTLFCGIDPERGIFVGADPVLHSPTRFFISIEYKKEHVEEIQKSGWYAWERDHRANDEKPIEILIGGTASSFLRYVRFERDAVGEDQGHRMLLAERTEPLPRGRILPAPGLVPAAPHPTRLHALAHEFALSESEVLDLIASARRLKMAVRGWVAEEHLLRRLKKVNGVTDCVRRDEEGGPDIHLRFEGSPVTVECKNVLRKTTAEGLARMDFQRTRTSKNDPCSRYYAPSDFDVVAACLHAVTERWEFRYAQSRRLDKHPRCTGKLWQRVRVDDRWNRDAATVLRTVVA